MTTRIVHADTVAPFQRAYYAGRGTYEEWIVRSNTLHPHNPGWTVLTLVHPDTRATENVWRRRTDAIRVVDTTAEAVAS